MGERRRLAWRGLLALATAMLIGSLVLTPAAALARPASAPAPVPMGHETAPRIARVDPRRIGTTRDAGSSSAFGVPAATSTGRPLLDGLHPSKNLRPSRFQLPHWLPGRRAGASTNSTPATRASGPASSGTAAVAAPAAESGAATSIRSDLGQFGLSDADDSLLYPDCNLSELCEEPPDPGIAVDAGSIVQSVNELILIVDRATGESTIVANFDFFALDSVNQAQESDPRVIHDAAHQRWLATEISGDCAHSYLHVAVSATNDPFGPWNVYRLLFSGLVVDFPGVGTYDSGVIVGLNAFGPDPAATDCLSPGDFAGGVLAVIDWADLTVDSVTLPVTTTKPDLKLFTWRPALSAGGDPLGRLVVAVDNGSDTTSDIGYATVSGSNADHNITVSPVINLTAQNGLAALSDPPAPRQPGKAPKVERAVDATPTDAISAGGHLWFIGTAPCTPPGDDTVRDCVRLVELLFGTDATAVVVADDVRFQEPGKDLFMGGVGRALDGTIYVVYSRSSPGDQIADFATFRQGGDSAFHTPVLIIPPGGEYSGTRWGDYVILAPDPAAPDAIWQADQVATAGGSWFTWVSRLRPAPVASIPAGSFTINGGDRFAGTDFVDLELTNPPEFAVTVIRFANDPTLQNGVLAAGQTLPVGVAMPWSLAFGVPGGEPPDGPRNVYVQWGDGLGNWSDVASADIILDRTAPTGPVLIAPKLVGKAISQGDATNIPVLVSWSAASDALSGVESYDVEVRPDGGAWNGFGDPGANLKTLGFVEPGHRYQWRVRAFDAVGNASAWHAGPAVTLSLLDDTRTSIQYSAGWSRVRSPSGIGTGYHATSRPGATATFSFTGRSIGLVATIRPGFGQFDVTVDGRIVRRIDLASEQARSRQIVFARNLAPGNHTIVTTNVGTSSAVVDLDALVVIR